MKPKTSSPRSASRAKPAASAAAATAAANHNHDNLVFSKITTQTELFTEFLSPGVPDPDSQVTVTCTATPNLGFHNRHDRTLYTFTIKRATATPDTAVTFSLLTLGLQASKHAISIRAARSTNNDASIVDPAGNGKVPTVSAPVTVPKTGAKPVVAGSSDENPIDTAIWFLSFSGDECRVEAFAIDRAERGNVHWVNAFFGVGHDNTPPPSAPN